MAGFTNRKTYNGVSYKVFVPENYNSNTEVLVYCHGGEDTDSNYATHFLNTNGGNTVVIYPTANESFRETNEYGGVVADIVSNVKHELNITNTGLSVAGFSKGSTPAYTTMGEYLKDNPNCSSSTLYLLDNYPNANYSSTAKFGSLFQEYGSYYKNNDTMFVAMIPQWDTSGTYIIGSKQAELDYLAKYGLTNVSVLHSYKASFPGNFPNENLAGSSHQCVEQVFWLDGIFNMNNDASLVMNADQYKLTIYNKSTGKYELTDFNNLNSLDKLRQYFGINIKTGTSVTTLNNGSDFLKDEINKLSNLSLYKTSNSILKSDKDILLSNVNNVISDIKNTSFVSNGLNLSFGGSSTTKVPSGIPNIMGLYFTFTTNILTELSSFMDKVANAGETIDQYDKELGNEAFNLNGEEQLRTDVLEVTNNNQISATVKDTREEVTTVVRDNYSSANTFNGYNTSTNHSNSVNNSSNSVSNTNKEQVSEIPRDTKEEVTTVVRGEGVFVKPEVNNNPVTNVVTTPDNVVVPEVEVDNTIKLPEVEVPKHDIGNINIGNPIISDEIITPEIDNILNNNDLLNVPITKPVEVKKDNTLGTVGLAVGVGTALGIGGVVAAKSLNKTKDDEKEEFDDEEYKDDYYEEV